MDQSQTEKRENNSDYNRNEEQIYLLNLIRIE